MPPCLKFKTPIYVLLLLFQLMRTMTAKLLLQGSALVAMWGSLAYIESKMVKKGATLIPLLMTVIGGFVSVKILSSTPCAASEGYDMKSREWVYGI